MEKIRHWLIEPSQHITGQAARRQASLLSALLLTIIVTGIIVELFTILTIQWEEYTGYYQTFIGASILFVIYLISRTRHFMLAAKVAVIFISIMNFVTGWYQPKGVLGGLFDFLIMPLWLASLYLHFWELAAFLLFNLAALLLFPLITDAVSFNYILVGPFSFIFITSILLFLMTRHRDLLEKDRQQDLANREKHSREEAERTKILLRVAAQLNKQLDLDALLGILSEEVAKAFKLRGSVITLYEKKQDALVVVHGWGMEPEILKSIPPFPKILYEQLIQNSKRSFSVSSVQHTTPQNYQELARKLDVRSMAIATMTNEHELIGNLIGIGMKEDRQFTDEELLLLQGMADQAALAIVNLRSVKDAQRRLDNLQALRAIDVSILKKRDLSETMDILLEKVSHQLGVDSAVVLIVNKERQELEYVKGRGLDDSKIQNLKLPIGEGLAGRAAKEKRIIYISDLRNDINAISLKSLTDKEGFLSYFAVPLITQNEVNGVLEIFHRSHIHSDDEWLGFLESLAGQASIAMGNAILLSELQRSNDELLKAYDSTIEGWSFALDLRDKETEGHTRRVTELTLDLAKEFGFNAEELVNIRRGGLLHDIGKLGIPDRILFKEDALAEDEWVLMKKHPVYALEMLQPIKHLQRSIDIPYCHHEKWDGSGYPRGLKGEEIPLTARLFAVVDVWDALTSDRSYRPAWSHEKALGFIKTESGKHFDPKVVEKFIHLIEQKDRNYKLRPFFRA